MTNFEIMMQHLLSLLFDMSLFQTKEDLPAKYRFY